jgi:hypothetical protein
MGWIHVIWKFKTSLKSNHNHLDVSENCRNHLISNHLNNGKGEWAGAFVCEKRLLGWHDNATSHYHVTVII